MRGALLTRANPAGAKTADAQLAQAKSLEGVTLPDGAKYTGKPALSPAEPEPQDAEGQPGLPGDLDAGDNDPQVAE